METLKINERKTRSKELFIDKENGKCIDCHKCKHYYVTWDKHFPHGCRAMKFKSKQFPSTVVFVSSSIGCLLFKKKKREATSEAKKADQAVDKKAHN